MFKAADPDSAWGVKRIKPVKDKHGKVRQIPETFFGYKIHASVNHQTDLVTSLMITNGAAYDGSCLLPLVNKDFGKGLTVGTVTADKGYDDGDLIYSLEQQDILAAIALKKTRTAPKWQELKDNPDYQDALNKRRQIERLFGEAKLHHGLGRCRYRLWLQHHQFVLQCRDASGGPLPRFPGQRRVSGEPLALAGKGGPDQTRGVKSSGSESAGCVERIEVGGD